MRDNSAALCACVWVVGACGGLWLACSCRSGGQKALGCLDGKKSARIADLSNVVG